MCGRFTLRARLQDLLAELDLQAALEFAPRYNIAPTQVVPIVTGSGALFARWGLVPSWAQDAKIGNSLINARAETVAEKPAFRAAFKRRRCLVLADGFYEWQRTGSAKQPFFIHRQDDRPFAFAGLYEHWGRATPPLDSCTIITTTPNRLMQPIHDRMPVILPPEAYRLWLDPEFEGQEALLGMLRPCAEEGWIATPVSTLVNNPRNESPLCVQSLAAE